MARTRRLSLAYVQEFDLTLPTAIYCRISKDDIKPGEDPALGVERQKKACLEFCQLMGFQVRPEYVFVDNDLSASKRDRKPRPAFERLMAQVRKGNIKRIVSTYLDRLYRDLRELEDLIDIANDTEVQPIPVRAGRIDLTTAHGRQHARLFTTIARGEAEIAQERIQDKHFELAEAGKSHGGGRRPYGYGVQRIGPHGEPMVDANGKPILDRNQIREDEAVFIREAAQRVSSGESVNSVVSDFNGRGIKTSTGGRWVSGTMRQMLASPRILGKRIHKGEIAADAVWPAIVDEVTWRRMKQRFDSQSAAVNMSSRTRKYLLTGLVRCGLCGEKMAGRPHSDGRKRYNCLKNRGVSGKACGRIFVVAGPVDEEVLNLTFAALLCQDFLDHLSVRAGGVPLSAMNAELLDVEQRLVEARTDYEIGFDDGSGKKVRITRAEYLASRRVLDAEKESLQRKLEAGMQLHVLEGVINNPDRLVDVWEGISLSRQQAILALVFDELKIMPIGKGKRFTPDRLDFRLAGDFPVARLATDEIRSEQPGDGLKDVGA